MKKMMVLAGLLILTTAAYAQESRQEASLSAEGIGGPQVYGNAVTQTSTLSGGFLASYRYMLTPRSALEANYGWAHNSQKFSTSSLNARIYTRQQEFSAAYVYTRNYHNFNPFAEIGVGALVFSPMEQASTSFLSAKRNTNIGGLGGLGLAYELSPSFDVRVEYRAFLAKAPNYGAVYGGTNFNTNRYEVFSIPSIGVSYHF